MTQRRSKQTAHAHVSTSNNQLARHSLHAAHACTRGTQSKGFSFFHCVASPFHLVTTSPKACMAQRGKTKAPPPYREGSAAAGGGYQTTPKDYHSNPRGRQGSQEEGEGEAGDCGCMEEVTARGWGGGAGKRRHSVGLAVGTTVSKATSSKAIGWNRQFEKDCRAVYPNLQRHAHRDFHLPCHGNPPAQDGLRRYFRVPHCLLHALEYWHTCT